jgi:hypothetical protein
MADGEMISGCCKETDCKCQVYRSHGIAGYYLCDNCKHDQCNHELIGFKEINKILFLGSTLSPASSVPQASPLVLKRTAEGQRREIFRPGCNEPSQAEPRRSSGTKRALSRASDRPSRTSMGTASSRGSELNSTVNIVVMRREDKVPTTHLERVELKHDFFENVILSTAAKLASSLKMSSVGDQLQDRFHIYVQDGKRTIRPTKFWSQEFPDATEIDALCRLKLIFVTSDCYVDEEKNFALIADADFVEVVASSSSSSSSSGAADATP